ncbi:MAG TPA: Qat anti-phage system associated protein QatB [Candidatus Sulfotelmatobacter sp.]|nr:Qat anti-phage system associated protein QatB [Candidatus Sulfotelmatobacter sp.]
MRRGIGRYVHDGYGGAPTASTRFGSTVSTAAALYAVLSSLSAGRPPVAGSSLEPTLLAGRPSRQIIDAIVEEVRPSDGTQDAEASRASLREALSEIRLKFKEAQLLRLSPEQRDFVVERFVAMDVYHRFILDLGKTIQDKAPSAASGLTRLNEVRQYIKETVSESFQKLREPGQGLSPAEVKESVRLALLETMQAFEAFSE